MRLTVGYRYLAPAFVAAALSLAIFAPDPPEPSAADQARTSEICLDCHTGQDSSLVHTAHRLSPFDAEGSALKVACTDCHGGDARHWEEDPEQFPMTNPSNIDAPAEARLCATCHMNSHQQNMQEKNIHLANDVSCSGCHRVHRSEHPSLLKQAESRLCLDCHGDLAGRFTKPFRHPVNDDIMQCSECHLTLDETKRGLSWNGTNVCMDCHGELQGPFPFEHQATVDYSTEEGACLTCHDQHGSSFPRMLNQPYEPPHFQLCSQCHSVPKHNQNTMHGTTFAGIPCNDCHTDIHGSYTSRLFLGEALEGQGCFNAGCHQF